VIMSVQSLSSFYLGAKINHERSGDSFAGLDAGVLGAAPRASRSWSCDQELAVVVDLSGGQDDARRDRPQ